MGETGVVLLTPLIACSLAYQIVWVAFITILFMLPQYSPVTRTSFNYAPVAVGVVLIGAGGWYLLSARKWFKAPKVQGTPEELEKADTATGRSLRRETEEREEILASERESGPYRQSGSGELKAAETPSAFGAESPYFPNDRSQGSVTAARRAKRALDIGHSGRRFSSIGGCISSRRI